MSTAGVMHTSHGGSEHIRLACQACQRKKIKCDRTFPCGQCTRSSLECVRSTRKPRARHGGKRAVDSELRNRISKLESLVDSLSGEVGLQDDHEDVPGDEIAAPSGPIDAASPTVGKYIGSPFWSSLTTEVAALRDALEERDGEEEDATSPTTSSGGAQVQVANDYDLIVCPPAAVYVMPGALDEPEPEMQAVLHGMFINNVSPMFKLFHIPTLRATLERGVPYLGHDASSPQIRALKAAIWFCAISTTSEASALEQFGRRRADLIYQYKRMTDVLLSQSDLICTTSLAVLQAFILYLASVRMMDLGRRAWTLIPLAVRIARAMGLDHEHAGRSPFETELRRRVWHQLRFLDVYTAMDRAAELTIQPDSFDTPLPSNANDVDFDELSTTIPNHENRLTDMSFALLVYETSTLTQRLAMPESNPMGDTWQRRLEMAQAFGNRVQERFLQHCDMSIPFHRLVHAVGVSISTGMILRAVRPMQRHVSSVPPRVDSPYVLQMAADALAANERIYEDPEAEPYRWLVWVQWHALAVALAGLCSIRETELAEYAWKYTNTAYFRYEKHVADTKNGMLWRPIEKLYRKATAFRNEGKRHSLSALIQNPYEGQHQRHYGIPQDWQGDDTNTAPIASTNDSNNHPTWTAAYTTSPPTTSTANNLTTTTAWPDFTTASLSPTTLPINPMDFYPAPVTTAASNRNINLNTLSSNLPSTTTTAMDLNTLSSNLPATYPAAASQDMSWMDWERIMDDFSGMPNLDNLAGMVGPQFQGEAPLELEGQEWGGGFDGHFI